MTGSSTDKIVRIAGASGALNDSLIAVPQLLAVPDLHYLAFDYLGEGAMGLMRRLKEADPRSGFLADFVDLHIGPYLAAGLKSLEDLPIVGEIQQVGLMAAVQLAEDKATRKRFEDKEKAGVTVRNHCLENGLVLRATGDRMLFSPPLVITHAEVDQMIDITRKGLEHAWKVMTA